MFSWIGLGRARAIAGQGPLDTVKEGCKKVGFGPGVAREEHANGVEMRSRTHVKLRAIATRQ